MTYLEENLGKTLTVQEVAAYLGLDPQTVRRYYKQLGGMRFGRSYRFFEKEVKNAIQAWQKMDRPNSQQWETDTENVSDQGGSVRLGIKSTEQPNAAGVSQRTDRHNLLT